MNYNVMHSDDNFMYVFKENKINFVFLLIIYLLYFVLI